MPPLYLIFHGRFPSEKAAALFAAKSAESFAGEGRTVTLFVPRRLGRLREDPFSYYHLHTKFKIVFLPTIDLFNIPFLNYFAFRISFFVFSCATVLHLLFKAPKQSIIYSNESLPLFFSSFFFRNTFYELHDFPERNHRWYRTIFRRVRGIVSHTKWKCEALTRVFGISHKKIFYEPNAVDLAMFDIPMTQEAARKKLCITAKHVVVYTGHLYAWKGVDILAEATVLLPPETEVYIVGGTDADIKKFTEVHKNIPHLHVVGFKPHTEIALWQRAADVLVLPNSGHEAISAYYTSPMKLFEYMASGVPIVASKLPSIEELVDTSTVFFFTPDDSKSCAETIMTVLQSPHEATERARRARTRVETWTWRKRAARILTFIMERVS